MQKRAKNHRTAQRPRHDAQHDQIRARARRNAAKRRARDCECKNGCLVGIGVLAPVDERRNAAAE
jgi:hypothetical protein